MTRNIFRLFSICVISGFLASTAFIPSALAKPDAEVFGQLPNIFDGAISPDGKRYAYIGVFNGQYNLLVRSFENPNDIQVVGFTKGAKPKDVRWANDRHVLARFWNSQKFHGVPLTASYIFTFDTEKEKGKILINPRIVRQFNDIIIDNLESDPDHILMAFSDDGNTLPKDIKKVDVATGRHKTIKRGLPNVDHWYTDLTGEPRVGQGRSPKTGEWNLRIKMTGEDKWLRAKDFPGLNADVDIHGFTGDPNELVVGLNRGRDTRGLYVYDLTSKSVTRTLFHNDEYDVGGVIYNGDGSDVIGASYVADDREIELFEQYDTVLGRMRQKFPGASVDYMDQSRDGKLVMFKASAPSDPGAIFMVNSDTDELKLLGSLYKGLTPDNLGGVTNVKYVARDGAKIPAYVTLPPSVTDSSQIKNMPFIILPHGGPYARESKRFDYLAQFFATRGYGVLQMNFRGSTGYGAEFKNAGRDNWVTMQEDVEDGAKFLLRKGYADPDRLCIAGWSYGGYAALMGTLKNPDLYNCAISMAGVTDLKDMIGDMKKYEGGRIAAKDFVLRGFEDKDDIAANSPVKLADNLSVPLFLAHGELDQRVHFDQFKRMKKALRKTDAKVTYMEFDDEDHYLSNEANRKKFFKGLDKFLVESNGESEFAQ